MDYEWPVDHEADQPLAPASRIASITAAVTDESGHPSFGLAGQLIVRQLAYDAVRPVCKLTIGVWRSGHDTAIMLG